MGDLDDAPLSESVRGYLHSRAKRQFQTHLLESFERLVASKDMSQAKMARILGKDPAQINRYLHSSSNMTIETLAELFASLGEVPVLQSAKINAVKKTAQCPVAHEGALYSIYQGEVKGHNSYTVSVGICAAPKAEHAMSATPSMAVV